MNLIGEQPEVIKILYSLYDFDDFDILTIYTDSHTTGCSKASFIKELYKYDKVIVDTWKVLERIYR